MPPVMPPTRAVLTIPNAGDASNAFQLGDYNSLIITTPAAWTAATLTFDISVDGQTWFPLYDDAAAEVSVASATIAASRALVAATILNKVFGATWLRLRSGPNGGRVAQGADRVFNVIAKRI